MAASTHRRPAEAGVSRAGLVLAIAIVAAGLVLAMGALRSGQPVRPGTSPGPTATAASGAAFASLPAVATVAPTFAVTPAPPDPTSPGVRGEFVGALGFVATCPVLYQRDGVVELILPDGYRARVRGGVLRIVDDRDAVVATEGDVVGLDGRVRDAGSACVVGPQLHVTEIVEVVARGAG